MFFSYQWGSLSSMRLLVDQGVGVGERRQERVGGEFQMEDDGGRDRAPRPCRPCTKLLWRALSTPWRRKDDLVPARRDVGGGQRRAVVELDALADLEGVGLAVVGRLRHLGAQIADEIGAVARVHRIGPDQDAVERRDRMDRRVGLLAMPVEARRRIGRDHIGQDAAVLRRLVGRGRHDQRHRDKPAAANRNAAMLIAFRPISRLARLVRGRAICRARSSPDPG